MLEYWKVPPKKMMLSNCWTFLPLFGNFGLNFIISNSSLSLKPLGEAVDVGNPCQKCGKVWKTHPEHWEVRAWKNKTWKFFLNVAVIPSLHFLLEISKNIGCSKNPSPSGGALSQCHVALGWFGWLQTCRTGSVRSVEIPMVLLTQTTTVWDI